MNIVKWNKSVWKVYILYDSKYMILWKCKIIATVKISVFTNGLGRGRER